MRKPTKAESFVILRGKVKVTIFNDDGFIKEFIILDPEKDYMALTSPRTFGTHWSP